MLENLEPKLVWKYFKQFCAIPHPSGFESEATQFIINQAETIGLNAISDSTGNVVIRKNATDSKKTETVILQSHLDMVPQKNETTIHDFRKDPIKPVIDGEWIKAQGTTLGADNGIGVAISLAILESSSIRHGPIEALFTIDEERGMNGAFALADDFITGRKLINLDTENEHEICIGCAGGTDIIARLPLNEKSCEGDYRTFQITLSGLLGGHSGIEIHLGHGNALKLMGQLLTSLTEQIDIRCAEFHGGSACNAIPREAFAVIMIPSCQIDLFKEIIDQHVIEFTATLHHTDPELRIEVSETEQPSSAMDNHSLLSILKVISACPNGILTMSAVMPGSVQTSNNCAIVNCHNGFCTIKCMLRSSQQQELLLYKNEISTVFTRHGASVTYGSMFPEWEPTPDSPLLDEMINAYISIHQKKPTIVVVHAGLECGIIKRKFPKMDIISCGPTISGAHSPDERLSIASVERFWRYLIAGLEKMG